MKAQITLAQDSFAIPPRYIPIKGIELDRSGTVSLIVTCQHGTMSMKDAAGNWIPGSFKRSISLSASAREANVALSNLVYKCPPGVTGDTITLTVDQGASVTVIIGEPTPATKPDAVGYRLSFGPIRSYGYSI